jgi:hypothetical protein
MAIIRISKSVVIRVFSIMEFGANSNKSPFLASILNQIDGQCNLSAHGINNSAFLQLVGLVDEKKFTSHPHETTDYAKVLVTNRYSLF